jgi:hypothetical protein
MASLSGTGAKNLVDSESLTKYAADPAIKTEIGQQSK